MSNNYEDLFDGSLGDINILFIKLELKEGTDPIHSMHFHVSHVQKETLYKEMQRIVALNIPEKVCCSAWASPTLIIPTPNGTVRMVSDFRKLNANLILKTAPYLKIMVLYKNWKESSTKIPKFEHGLLHYTPRPTVTRYVYNRNSVG